MTQAYTRKGSTNVDYSAVTGDSVTGAAQKLDAALNDIYTQIQDGSTVVKGVLQIGTGATQAAAGNHLHTGTYAPAAEGVTNGNTHDHSGGDGGTIAYANVSGTPTISAFGATLIDDSDASASRTTLGLVIGTDVQAYDADTAKTDVQQAWSKPQRPTPSSVNIGSAFDASAYAAIKHTLAANTTVAAPSNTPTEGDELYLHITGASTYTLAWNTAYKAHSGLALPAAPGAGKVLSACFRYDGTNWQMIGYRVDA